MEFDVQLSKDMIPVLYHDFQVCTVLRKVVSITNESQVSSLLSPIQKKKHDLQYLEIPVKDLTLTDLQALKLDPTCVMSDEQRDESECIFDVCAHC